MYIHIYSTPAGRGFPVHKYTLSSDKTSLAIEALCKIFKDFRMSPPPSFSTAIKASGDAVTPWSLQINSAKILKSQICWHVIS